MFKKLHRQIILINLIVTTVVLVVAFVAIYLVAAGSAKSRPVKPNLSDVPPATLQDFTSRINSERQASLSSLLTSLIVVGCIVEVAVIIISYVLAEVAIRPIRESYEQQKLFIANASHEIKTPLAVISANLEAADISDNHWINNAAREVEYLTTLNQRLLKLSQLEAMPSVQSQPEPIMIKELFQEIITEFELRVKNNELKIKVLPATAKIKSSRSDLRQLLTILIDNAIKYHRSYIRIDYQARVFRVENDGAIIPEEALPRIFDRFYQVDKSASGVGLGLAIAKALADKNNWELTVSSGDSKTCFQLRV